MTKHHSLQFLPCDWEPNLLLWDSPLCPNSSAPHQSCERRAFFDFVAESKHELRTPCHPIPLNRRDKVQSRDRRSTQQALDHAMKDWLEAATAKRNERRTSHERS